MNFKIIFNLDGCGVYFDPNEPIHLDSLLTYILAPKQTENIFIGREDIPADIELPLLKKTINGHKVWCASALFPESNSEIFETLRFWRKKFRTNRINITNGVPNLKSGVYREYNMPVPLILIPRLVAYASGNRKEVKKLLQKNIKGLGKKRAYGYGKVVSVETEEIENDYSFIKDGFAMRFLPKKNGVRCCRVSPPYWNYHNAINCCEIGEKYELNNY